MVELMLAISLFAFLIGSVAGLIRWSLQLQTRWGAEQAPHQRLDRAFSDLARDVESAQPLFNVPVTGQAGRLELAAVERTGAGAQWRRVVYRLDAVESGATLVREAFQWSDPAEEAQPLTRTVLTPLDSLAFAFGMRNPDTQAIEWVPQWDGEQHGVPQLVQATCTLPAHGSQPPITITRVMRNPAGSLPVRETP